MTRDGPCDMFALSDISAQVSVCLEAECKGWGVCLREREKRGRKSVAHRTNDARKRKGKKEGHNRRRVHGCMTSPVFSVFFFWRFFCVPHKQTERKKLKKPKAQKTNEDEDRGEVRFSLCVQRAPDVSWKSLSLEFMGKPPLQLTFWSAQ